MTATAVLKNNSYFNTFDSVSKNSFSNEKPVYGSHNEIYDDITVLKALNKAKFPVYLVESKVNKQTYAMKIFPFKDRKLHPYFKNEIRFSGLQHPNVIRNLYIEDEKDTVSKGVHTKVSYTIMEYAPYGDFFDFVMDHGDRIDEKLARTYFKQLIQGLEYLHKHGVSHLDLKLENLLVGSDYSLKIADFDLSHFEGDAKILSKGTNYYRSLELKQTRCKNTYAADIYAAGVILFTLKTKGVLPHSEDNLISGTNFSELLHNNDPAFWTKHCRVQKKDQSFFDNDFKELFIAMTRPNAEERATLDTIKKSKWYNGPCYTPEEVKSKVSKLYGY